MKKLNFSALLSFALLAFTIVFTSCSKDDSPVTPEEQQQIIIEDELPTITLISGSPDVFNGVIGAPGFGSLQHTVKAIAPEGLSELNIYKVVDGVQSGYISFDTNGPNYDANTNSYTHNLSYILSENDVDKDLYFIAEVIDANNNVETLDFAEAIVKHSMLFVETIFMETRIPLENNTMSTAQFLQVDDLEVGGVNLNRVIDEQINDKIAAVLSISEGEGIYLSSPNSLVNQATVNEIQNKSTTKFKKLNNEVLDLNLYNIYDTFTIESLFDDAAFGSHQQRAAQINENDFYVFRTDDNRTALFKITYFEIINNSEVYLTMDMFITQ